MGSCQPLPWPMPSAPSSSFSMRKPGPRTASRSRKPLGWAILRRGNERHGMNQARQNVPESLQTEVLRKRSRKGFYESRKRSPSRGVWFFLREGTCKPAAVALEQPFFWFPFVVCFAGVLFAWCSLLSTWVCLLTHDWCPFCVPSTPTKWGLPSKQAKTRHTHVHLDTRHFLPKSHIILQFRNLRIHDGCARVSF